MLKYAGAGAGDHRSGSGRPGDAAQAVEPQHRELGGEQRLAGCNPAARHIDLDADGEIVGMS
ncbi:hypothetical protein [Candidatus Poriferisodalis sp.]|uniref:hypothetical protein n=1 Tax=Candidatus Poriferisodalis sp. TaxID=3101277 RepID=UPI003B0267A5